MATRQQWLIALVAVVALVALFVVGAVWQTVVFAATVASVFLPLRRRLVERRVGPRVAAGICTVLAFLAALGLVIVVVWPLYRYQSVVVAVLRRSTGAVSVTIGETTLSLPMAALRASAESIAGSLAVGVAGTAPVLVLKGMLFALVVYGLLVRPTALRRAANGVLPAGGRDVLAALTRRAQSTVAAIYVLQGATAAGTFGVAALVFAVLGYPAPVALAGIAAILQFIPVVGPSVLVVALAAGHLLVGDVPAALTVLVVGLVVVAGLPDVVIRPALAPYTTSIPTSLYFVGFGGGVLSVGAVGFVAGPLVVALLVECVDLLAAERERTLGLAG